MAATAPTRNNREHRTLSERISRLEGRVSVMVALDVGTFLAVLALIIARAFA